MATPPPAIASGERAVALINSSHNVVWTGDLVLGAEAPSDDVLLLARAMEQNAPRCVRRDHPLNRPPAPPADRIDREPAIADLGAALGEGATVNLVGTDGVGKSYVLRAAIADVQARDGVVWIDGEGRDADDVLQAVFHELYDAHQIVADRERRRAAFAEVQLLVVVDGGDRAAPAAGRLRDELEGSAVLLVSRAGAEWTSSATPVGVAGLDERDAIDLIARRLGPLDETARPAAERLAHLLAGNPRRLVQAAGLAARTSLPLATLVASLEGDPDGELRRLLLQALEPADREMVEALAGACGATLARERLRALTGLADAAARAERLEQEGLVRAHSPRYRPAGALAGLRVPGRAERTAEHLSEFARTSDPDKAAEEIPAALALLEWAQDEGRDDLVITLGRAIAPAGAYGRRWGAWGAILEQVRAAAGRTGDRASEAWALHHIGTRAFALGNSQVALAALRDALELRKRLGDEPGAAATRHNLEFIVGPPGAPPDEQGGPVSPRPGGRALILGGAVAGALAIAGVVALAGGGSDERATPTASRTSKETRDGGATRRVSIEISSPRSGVYAEGTRVTASFTCQGPQLRRCDGDVDGKPLEPGGLLPTTPGRHLVHIEAEAASADRRVEEIAYTVRTEPTPQDRDERTRAPEPGPPSEPEPGPPSEPEPGPPSEPEPGPPPEPEPGPPPEPQPAIDGYTAVGGSVLTVLADSRSQAAAPGGGGGGAGGLPFSGLELGLVAAAGAALVLAGLAMRRWSTSANVPRSPNSG
jgi:hypothetical protein